VAGDQAGALTPAQAKQRLREAAMQTGPAGWVRQRPYEALMLALVAGIAVGTRPRLSGSAASRVLDALIRCL